LLPTLRRSWTQLTATLESNRQQQRRQQQWQRRQQQWQQQSNVKQYHRRQWETGLRKGHLLRRNSKRNKTCRRKTLMPNGERLPARKGRTR